MVRRMGACHAGCVECFRRGLDFGLIGRERAETVGSGDRGLAWPRPPMGAAFGLAVAFFCLLGSQGDPRPLATYGLVLATPLVLLLTLQTRSAWLAASFLVFLGIAVRLATLDRHYFGSDVILVTREALRTILDGHNPYGHHYVVSDNPFAYPPGNLLYYLPGYLMDDTRATEIFSSAVVLIGLAWVAARTRSDGAIASLGLYAAAPPLNVLTNALWNAATSALSAWNSCPKLPKSAAMAVDTSSAAAGAKPVVGATMARATSSSDERIPSRSWAATSTRSGAATTKDMFISPTQMNGICVL